MTITDSHQVFMTLSSEEVHESHRHPTSHHGSLLRLEANAVKPPLPPSGDLSTRRPLAGSAAPLRVPEETLLDEPASPSIIRAIREKNEEIFALLVRQYHGALVRTARRLVPSRMIAVEVAQETWAGVIEGIDRFRSASSFRTWLFGILIHKAISAGVRERRAVNVTRNGHTDDRLSMKRSVAEVVGRMESPSRLASSPPTPEALYFARELSRQIDSPAFTGGVLSEFKLRLSRVFLSLSRDVPANDLFGNPHRRDKVTLGPDSAAIPVHPIQKPKLLSQRSTRILLDRLHHKADAVLRGDHHVHMHMILVDSDLGEMPVGIVFLHLLQPDA